jgi:hypothetical protein
VYIQGNRKKKSALKRFTVHEMRFTTLAAIAAWPRDIPPSLAGTSQLNNTRKSFCLNSITKRSVKYRLQNTPPLSAAVSSFVLSLARLAIASRAMASVL